MNETRGIGRTLLARWWVVLVVTLTCLGASYFYTSKQRSVYRAKTTVVVRPSSEVSKVSEILRSLDTLERRSVIATFAKIPGTARTRESIAKRLDEKPRTIRRYSIRGSVVPNTNLITIEVHGPDRARVADVANAAASKMRRDARRLYRIFALDVLEKAKPARRRVYPDPQRNYVAAGILGLFLGCGAALAFDQLRRWRGTVPASERTDDAPPAGA